MEAEEATSKATAAVEEASPAVWTRLSTRVCSPFFPPPPCVFTPNNLQRPSCSISVKQRVSADAYVLPTGVDKFASEEGVPGMADGSINKEVNSEVGKFS